jgi:hypothetical protein
MTKGNYIWFKCIEALQTTLAADAHLAGQFLIERLKLNIEKSLRYREGTVRPTASKREGQISNHGKLG